MVISFQCLFCVPSTWQERNFASHQNTCYHLARDLHPPSRSRSLEFVALRETSRKRLVESEEIVGVVGCFDVQQAVVVGRVVGAGPVLEV